MSQDIDRIVEEITQRLMGAMAGGEWSLQCAPLCVAENEGSMRLLIGCGAERLGLRAADPRAADGLARYIDHTLLKADALASDIERLCSEAREYRFAAVCLNPVWVSRAARLLASSEVAVCTVVGFPLGASASDVKVYETRRAIFDGASEIDMVLQIGRLKGGEDDCVRRDIEGVVQACRENGAICKVILETALLTDEEKVRACTLAKSAGADFVKTSTGFGPSGASAADVALMRRAVGPDLGVKAAGGIKDRRGTEEMISAGATRIGASAGIRIVRDQAAPPAAGH